MNFGISRSVHKCVWSLGFKFSSEAQNIRVPLYDPITNKPNDEYIERYQNFLFNAYLHKKKIKRS